MGFEALGTKITLDDYHEVELDYRISRAWAAYYKYKYILKKYRTPLRDRLTFLSKIVATGVFWCSGSLKLTIQQQERLATRQRKMIGGLLKFRRLDDEADDEFFTRRRSVITKVMTKYSVEPWIDMWHRYVFTWAGVVARQGNDQPERIRIAKQILDFRDLMFIHNFAKKNKGWQRHTERFHV